MVYEETPPVWTPTKALRQLGGRMRAFKMRSSLRACGNSLKVLDTSSAVWQAGMSDTSRGDRVTFSSMPPDSLALRSGILAVRTISISETRVVSSFSILHANLVVQEAFYQQSGCAMSVSTSVVGSNTYNSTFHRMAFNLFRRKIKSRGPLIRLRYRTCSCMYSSNCIYMCACQDTPTGQRNDLRGRKRQDRTL